MDIDKGQTVAQLFGLADLGREDAEEGMDDMLERGLSTKSARVQEVSEFCLRGWHCVRCIDDTVT